VPSLDYFPNKPIILSDAIFQLLWSPNKQVERQFRVDLISDFYCFAHRLSFERENNQHIYI